MKKLVRVLSNFEERIITLLLPIMCLTVFIATFSRFTKLFVIPWGDELSRYLLVWLVFLGAGAGAKENKHFSISILTQALPEKARKYFALFRFMVVFLFCGYVIYLSLLLMKAQIKMQQVSPALGLPIWMAYLAIPVGMGLMGLRTIQYYIKQKKLQNEGVN